MESVEHEMPCLCIVASRIFFDCEYTRYLDYLKFKCKFSTDCDEKLSYDEFIDPDGHTNCDHLFYNCNYCYK